MSTPQYTPQAIQDRYWTIANDPNERGYSQVRALDSLCRLLDLFPRGQQPAPDPPQPEQIDPNLLIAGMTDAQIDALIAREQAEAEAKAKAEAERTEEDDEASSEEEDDPL